MRQRDIQTIPHAPLSIPPYLYRPEFPLMSAHCAYLPVPSKAIVPSLPAQTASAPAANAAGITQADKATVKIIKTFLCLVLSLIIFDNELN